MLGQAWQAWLKRAEKSLPAMESAHLIVPKRHLLVLVQKFLIGCFPSKLSSFCL